jgi:hypothetical protein
MRNFMDSWFGVGISHLVLELVGLNFALDGRLVVVPEGHRVPVVALEEDVHAGRALRLDDARELPAALPGVPLLVLEADDHVARLELRGESLLAVAGPAGDEVARHPALLVLVPGLDDADQAEVHRLLLVARAVGALQRVVEALAFVSGDALRERLVPDRAGGARAVAGLEVEVEVRASHHGTSSNWKVFSRPNSSARSLV